MAYAKAFDKIYLYPQENLINMGTILESSTGEKPLVYRRKMDYIQKIERCVRQGH